MSQSPEERTARRKLYKSLRWRSTRARQLRREPQCRACALRGITTPAEHVDHIDPVPDPVMKHLRHFWRGPFQSLCHRCHSVKTINERLGLPVMKGCDAEGNPVDPASHCYPSSGLQETVPGREDRGAGGAFPRSNAQGGEGGPAHGVSR